MSHFGDFITEKRRVEMTTPKGNRPNWNNNQMIHRFGLHKLFWGRNSDPLLFQEDKETHLSVLMAQIFSSNPLRHKTLSAHFLTAQNSGNPNQLWTNSICHESFRIPERQDFFLIGRDLWSFCSSQVDRRRRMLKTFQVLLTLVKISSSS